MNGRRWLPPLLWAAFILVLTSIPGADLPRVGVRNIDKAVHLTMYGVFGWLLVRALFRRERSAWVALAVVVVVSLFGAADEWHQQFIPGRTMDVLDWIFDTSGAALGALLAVAQLVRRVRRT